MPTGTVSPPKRRGIQTRILAFLAKHPFASRTAIAAALPGRYGDASVATALWRLVSGGLVVRHGLARSPNERFTLAAIDQESRPQ